MPLFQELKEFVNTTSSPKRRRQVKDLLERIARNSEWASKQRESMVFDVHNLSQCSQLQGAAPLLKGSGKTDAAWGSQGWGLQVREGGVLIMQLRVACVCDSLVQDDDEVEEQEEQRRVERKSKRQDVESADEDAGEDESGSDDEGDGGGRKAAGSGSRVIDSDKAKKQDAKNAKQKVPFCSAWPLLCGRVPTPPPLPPPARPIAWKRRSSKFAPALGREHRARMSLKIWSSAIRHSARRHVSEGWDISEFIVHMT
jgi:hypothetical protein